jgi:16S rRNA (guanine1516-N2)-methyltransferase
LNQVIIMGSLATTARPIVITPATPSQQDAACHLAQRLNLPVDSNPAPSAIKLLLTQHRLELHHSSLGGALFTEFVGGALGYRRRQGQTYKQPLARAVGLKHNVTPTVLDATAGLGRDAFILASWGCSLVLIEQSPLIAALLEDGLNRARRALETAAIAARMQLIQTDSIPWMGGLSPAHRPEVVYLDPMYPERRKSALVKKEMRVLHALIEKDETGPSALLRVALECARQRVVVKRPRLALAIEGLPPDFAVASKNTRFDIYLTGKHQ